MYLAKYIPLPYEYSVYFENQFEIILNLVPPEKSSHNIE